MDRIIELLASITEDSTIEEARRVIADCIDEAQKVKDDITGLKQSIDDINAVNVDLTDEITRLKEENGRLYRDRVRTATDIVEEKVEDTLTPEQEADELLEAIDY